VTGQLVTVLTSYIGLLYDQSANLLFCNTDAVLPGSPAIYVTANTNPNFSEMNWITYRRDFSPIGEGVSSDAGWGCTIRAVQMLTANAMVKAEERKKDCTDILRFFSDDPQAPLGIHRIVGVTGHVGE
jgi:hypothetical protein